MVNPDSLKSVFTALSEFLEMSFSRAEDDGPRPRGVFFSYKMLSQQDEPPMMRIESFSPVQGDESKVHRREECVSEIPVSLTFFASAKDYYDLWAQAKRARGWFESRTGKDLCAQWSVYPIIRGGVQDRTAYLETGYESRIGFDIAFTGNEVSEEIIDAVDIAATIAGIQEEA